MKEWRKVKLGEICKIKSGKRLPKGCDFSDIPTKYKYIRARDIKNGIINGEGLACISEDTQHKISKYIVNSDDIVITIVGASVGDVAYVSSLYNGVNLTENAVRLTQFNDDVNSRYLFYILNSPNYYKLMQRIAGGAAQPKMGIYKVEAIEVNLPSIYTQKRIATILSRYDSLIENFQKQIKLLEESAQRLYKEWFINLRFPGHENTKIVDGVPEGWEKANLGTLVEFKRGKTITKKEAVEGNIPVVAGGLEPAYYCNKSNTSERVITISASGANAGYTKMYFEKVWASDCSFADNSMTPYLHFIFCFLRDNKTTIDNMQKGSAQPHVYAKDINAMELCLPETSILQTFEEKVSKCFDTISSLIFQIRLLTEARDRLLPKLMSGEIEV